ncbi:MAG: hypothetical protein GX567_04045 [Clostridia bacterium]|nr:hypothetical protein [Clostridia bacterium]
MKNLLAILENQNIRSTAQLAEELGTTSEMIEARLEHYAKLGYVKKTVMNGSDCENNCKKCKGCNHCQNDRSVVFWEKKKMPEGRIGS